MTDRLLHFTLGPVQGFVAQARRTGDLWAGSFLLSWLAGQAMKVVVERDGTILVPDLANDALFRAITNPAAKYDTAVGSLPNRFKAKVPETFDPTLCHEAIDEAWRRLANSVWQRFVASIASQGNGTQTIWNRQVSSFWEMACVIGPADGQDYAWLDRRKNWRTHRPPVEGGDHCMLMGDWQELSGFVRSRERPRQDAFWRALKAHVDQTCGNPLQLDENERLCAMALIKRLFPHVAKEALGWTPSWDGQQPLRWPSTPRLAATGWLRHAWKKAPQEAKAFAEIAKNTKGGLMEPSLGGDNVLSQVSGALLQRSGIENARLDELAGSEGDAEATRAKLLEAHKALSNEAGEPSAFYAVLLMDGDRVGAMLRSQEANIGSQEANIARGLAGFSTRVDATIREHGGNTIYAGGDDVLALLPLEGAVPAALELRRRYRNAFAITPKPTISAALVFAHFHVPLRHVLREARRQLDEVAKDGNGRDSLAVCVLTQSGVTREWVSMWETDTAAPAQTMPAQTMIDAAQDIDAKTSGRFFYALREQYDEVIAGNVLGDDDIKSLLIAEYRRSEAGAGRARDDIHAHVDRLFVLAERHAARDSARIKEAPSVSMDGPLIVRFLARETRHT